MPPLILLGLILTLGPPDLAWVDSGAMPGTLSACGVLDGLKALSPAKVLIPYELNVPFWSDGAAKLRWMILPRRPDGSLARIGFAREGEWTFPAGTVFVKHFALGERRLETRLLVVEASGEVHGGSYRWRGDHSDADLVREAASEVLVTSENRKQTWFFPGLDDCRKCHSKSAGGVLGVKTRQLNREDPGHGNLLRDWGDLGLFEPRIDVAELSRMSRLARGDEEGRSLEDRARSYLDANCSHCHRPGGVVADFDGRFDTKLSAQGLIGEPARINLGIDNARLVGAE